MPFTRRTKRKISYQWRLFIPVVATLWITLLSLASWQYIRERDYRRAFVNSQLDIVNKRVIGTLNMHNQGLLDTFLPFVEKYYEDNELFDGIHLSIYDSQWNVTDSIGPAIKLTPEERKQIETEIQHNESFTTVPDLHFRDNKQIYRAEKTADKQQTVITALPIDADVEQYLAGDSTEVWIIVFIVAIIITILCYFSTRHLGRNIRILRDLANRSANDPGFFPGNVFSHDELGDIARRVVQMFNERALARQRTEREHRVALHAIEEKARQKRELTNNINHELKTPIGVIKGYLDTIIDTPDMDPDTRLHFVSKARDHANRLVNLIAEVSAITRLEEGQKQINTEELDFHEIVYTFINDLRESGAGGAFTYDFNIPIGAYIRGNNSLLTGMLLNLAKNSINYSHGDHIQINFIGEEANFLKFTFFDNGTGVPEEALEHLFDQFYRIDSGRTRKAGGTGLGLAIVFNTVKAHGGTIIAKNRPEGGLEFIFTLPKWQ